MDYVAIAREAAAKAAACESEKAEVPENQMVDHLDGTTSTQKPTGRPEEHRADADDDNSEINAQSGPGRVT